MDNQISQIVISMAYTAALCGRVTNLKYAQERRLFFVAVPATGDSSCSLRV